MFCGIPRVLDTYPLIFKMTHDFLHLEKGSYDLPDKMKFVNWSFDIFSVRSDVQLEDDHLTETLGPFYTVVRSGSRGVQILP